MTWAASVWKKIFRALQIFPISSTGWITPISLFTIITLTCGGWSEACQHVFWVKNIAFTRLVSGLRAASNCSRSIRPLCRIQSGREIFHTRSLGALRALTSSWWPFGLAWLRPSRPLTHAMMWSLDSVIGILLIFVDKSKRIRWQI